MKPIIVALHGRISDVESVILNVLMLKKVKKKWRCKWEWISPKRVENVI